MQWTSQEAHSIFSRPLQIRCHLAGAPVAPGLSSGSERPIGSSGLCSPAKGEKKWERESQPARHKTKPASQRKKKNVREDAAGSVHLVSEAIVLAASKAKPLRDALTRPNSRRGSWRGEQGRFKKAGGRVAMFTRVVATAVFV